LHDPVHATAAWRESRPLGGYEDSNNGGLGTRGYLICDRIDLCVHVMAPISVFDIAAHEDAAIFAKERTSYFGWTDHKSVVTNLPRTLRKPRHLHIRDV
jgi:hypothetical protein